MNKRGYRTADRLQTRAKMTMELFCFQEPGPETRGRLRQLIGKLPRCHARTVRRFSRQIGVPALKGSLEAVLDLMMATLYEDYEENLREPPEWDGGFDYVVERAGWGALSVDTRLYPRAGSGSIRYGRTVARTGPELFAVWTDS